LAETPDRNLSRGTINLIADRVGHVRNINARIFFRQIHNRLRKQRAD
jgi:hypothetical protein